MDLAANEKAVHADFFNGKDAWDGDARFNLNVSSSGGGSEATW